MAAIVAIYLTCRVHNLSLIHRNTLYQQQI